MIAHLSRMLARPLLPALVSIVTLPMISLSASVCNSHGPSGALVTASTGPALLHHWPTARIVTASAGAGLLHHWPTAQIVTASLGASLLHHWPTATVLAPVDQG